MAWAIATSTYARPTALKYTRSSDDVRPFFAGNHLDEVRSNVGVGELAVLVHPAERPGAVLTVSQSSQTIVSH